jgi:Uma2 family endonuclease
MSQKPFTVRRWTRAEYDQLVDLGAFDREPVELVGGQLIVAEPQGSYHVTSVGMIASHLGAVLPPGWIVRVQAPLALDAESEPEPDIAALIIEVADSSLAFDRGDKGSLYARARLADYPYLK